MDYTCAKSVIVSWETGFAVLKIVAAFIHSKLFFSFNCKACLVCVYCKHQELQQVGRPGKSTVVVVHLTQGSQGRKQICKSSTTRHGNKTSLLVSYSMSIYSLLCTSFLGPFSFFPHCSWQRENDNNVQILLSLTSICQGADSLEPSMLHIRLDCRLHNSRVFAQQQRVVIVLELFWIYELAYSSSTCLEEIFSTFQTSQSIGLEGKEDICCFGTLILLKLSQSKRIFSNRLFRYHFNGFKGLLQKQPAYQQIEFAVLRIVRKKVQNCTHDVFHPFFSLISAEHFFQFRL